MYPWLDHVFILTKEYLEWSGFNPQIIVLRWCSYWGQCGFANKFQNYCILFLKKKKKAFLFGINSLLWFVTVLHRDKTKQPTYVLHVI